MEELVILNILEDVILELWIPSLLILYFFLLLDIHLNQLFEKLFCWLDMFTTEVYVMFFWSTYVMYSTTSRVGENNDILLFSVLFLIGFS